MSDSAGQSNSGKPYEVYFFGTCSLNGDILECWQVRESGDEICNVFARLDHPLVSHQQDRRNMVYKVAACLNACDEINPEAVPELVKACERIVKMLSTLKDPTPDERATISIASSALAKAKGGAA